MNKLNIGVMGCAGIALRSMIPAIKTATKWNLVAVTSRTKEKVEQFSVKFNREAVFGNENLLHRDDIDAIYLPLPTGLDDETIKKCFAAGKHW